MIDEAGEGVFLLGPVSISDLSDIQKACLQLLSNQWDVL